MNPLRAPQVLPYALLPLPAAWLMLVAQQLPPGPVRRPVILPRSRAKALDGSLPAARLRLRRPA